MDLKNKFCVPSMGPSDFDRILKALMLLGASTAYTGAPHQKVNPTFMYVNKNNHILDSSDTMSLPVITIEELEAIKRDDVSFTVVPEGAKVFTKEEIKVIKGIVSLNESLLNSFDDINAQIKLCEDRNKAIGVLLNDLKI